MPHDRKQCDVCNKLIAKKNFARHIKSHQHRCPNCPKTFGKLVRLQYHIATKHGANRAKSFVCRVCHQPFQTFHQLSFHNRSQHQNYPSTSNVNNEMDLSEFNSDPNLLSEMRTVQHFLTDSKIQTSRKIVYNFRLNSLDEKFIDEKLDFIHSELPCAAKLNFSFGFVLQNIQNHGEFRYFYAENNNPVFHFPVIFSTLEDLEFIKERYEDENVFESIIQQRPDTKWRFYCVTNVTFFVYLMPRVALGCTDVELPNALIRNKSVKCFLSDSNSKPYHDNLCLFRAIAFDLHGSENLSNNSLLYFTSFLSESGQDAIDFPGVSPEEIPLVEKITSVNLNMYSLYYDEEGLLLGELSRRSAGLFGKGLSLVQYNNHVCWVSNINTLLKNFRCHNCDKYFTKSSLLDRHLLSCDDKVKHTYPNGPYELRETIFEKLEGINIHVETERRLFQNLAVFDFEALAVPLGNNISNQENTTWIARHVPISVAISSNLCDQPIFICCSDPRELVSRFVDELRKLSEKSATQYRELFKNELDEIAKRINQLIEELPRRKKRQPTNDNLLDEAHEDNNEEIDDEDIQNDPTLMGLFQEKETLTRVLLELEKYCDYLPVFGFNSSKYDLNLIKQYLLEYLLLEHECSPSVIKVSNKYISCSFMGIQFLDILNFLGGATSLDKFLKAYGASEEKGFFPYEWFDDVVKLEQPCLPPAEAFFSKLKNCNVLDSDYQYYIQILNQGVAVPDALRKLGLKEIPKTKEENYEALETIWIEEGMLTFRDFLEWYNVKDVKPTLEAMLTMMKFYHDRGIDMLKLGCTLPNLANRILHSSTNFKFFPFIESDRQYDDYIRKWLTGGPSIIFTRYAKVGDTKIKNSSNVCKAIVGIDASHLYPFAMTKELPTGPYTKWELKEDNRFHPNRLRRSHFEELILEFQQFKHPECSIQTQFNGKQKKFGRFSVDGYCSHCSTVFEAMGCFYHFCHCQEKRRLPLEDIEKGVKRRQSDAFRRRFLRSKGLKIVEIWECQWWRMVKSNEEGAKDFMKKNHPFIPPLSEASLLQRIRQEQLFGVLDCTIEVPMELRDQFADFPPIFKNCDVSREDIGTHMRSFAQINNLLKKPTRMLISSFKLERGPIITPLLNFYLEKGLVVKKIHWFLQYKPKKTFEGFVSSVVQARRRGDENKDSSVVAETMKLIANSSYGYQIMDRSKHTNTQFVVGSEVDKLVNNRMFKRFHHLPREIFEVELGKRKIEHKEPIIVGFFLYSNMLNLLCFNYTTTFSNSFVMIPSSS